MIRVLFLISSLNRGGAESQLALLVRGLDRTRFAVTVVTIYGGGGVRPRIESLDHVCLLSLNKKGRSDIPRSLWRLYRLMRRERPHIVHGYLDVANELAVLFGKQVGAKVVWGIRASNVDFSHYGRTAALHFRVAAMLSRFADLIIANSYAGKQHHVEQGYSERRLIVIPNGFDTERFRPDFGARNRMRRSWGIAEHEHLIGLVARLDPMKDHTTFMRAAVLLSASRPNVRFVCVGGGREPYHQELRRLCAELGLQTRLVWAGELNDMVAAQNALDVATSSTSFGEGFSNAIGEAMACGVPCVATDVGDSAVLIGSTGRIVPPGDPEALAAAWSDLLNMPVDERNALGTSARQRIVCEYSLPELARKTEEALARLVADAR